MKLDPVAKAGVLSASPRKFKLLVGQRHAIHARSAGFGQIASKPTPAGTDIEHMLSWLDQQLRGEVSLLGKLGVIERLIRTFKIRAAILSVGIEKHRVEPPIQIVVMCNILLRSIARIELFKLTPKVSQKPLRLRPSCGIAGTVLRENHCQ